MIRTQIQITAEQEQAMRQISLQQGVSRSEIIRQALDAWLNQQQKRGTNKTKALAAIGQFASGSSNGSEEHDHYLADAFSL